MLTPRYGTFEELIGDYKRILDGMNRVQPLEPGRHGTGTDEAKALEESKRVASPVYESDDDMRFLMATMSAYDPTDMTEAINHLYALEQDLADSYVRIGRHGLAEMHPQDKAVFVQKHTAACEAARMAAKRAVEAADRAGGYGNMEGQRTLQEKHSRLLNKSFQHSKALKKFGGTMTESVRAPMLETGAPMERFRELAGMDDYEASPRDPGQLGSARFNNGYAIEALGEDY